MAKSLSCIHGTKPAAHPSELTAGFYNTVSRDGYEAVAEMFARNSCKMILPGMDLSDKHQPQESLSSPESMLAQIRIVCRKHRVEISGQNSVRMGADFFSPEHFPSFTHFVRNLNQLEMFSDDLPEEEEVVESVLLNSESNSRMQAA
ncbi:hypothetical protein OIU84_021914 [Salix udensis]|uniref:Beta-amylase n=1 Tax=Salix udensis TaxID=889485 RepID=A0AAD6PIS5_9ROSI|nr:hypothetical protein OIU84_021914 [Salix udensis]